MKLGHELGIVVVSLSLFGCNGDDGGGDYMDDHPPSGCQTDGCPATSTGGASTSGTGGATTAGDADACKSSPDCGVGLVCVGGFDGDNRTPYACVAECVEANDESRWCADANACCDPDATCTDRGYCRPDGGGTGATSTSTSTSTGGEP